MFLLTMTQDVIFYYRKIFPKLRKFLQEREIATKTMLKEVEIVKRGSNSPPLYIDELIKGVNDKFLNLRKENHLKDVKQTNKDSNKDMGVYCSKKTCRTSLCNKSRTSK